MAEQSRAGRSARPAEVRFYVDADLLGLAKILVQLRPDVTYPGDPGGTLHKRTRLPCPITDPAMKDRHWIPLVAQQNWLIITRDSAIQGHTSEIGAVKEYRGRMVAISARNAGTKFDQLETVMSQWRRIEAAAAQPGPFIYTLTRTTFTPVELG